MAPPPFSACADEAPAAWGPSHGSHNRLGNRAIRTSVANRRRCARFASERGCRLTPVHARSYGPSPAGPRRPSADRKAGGRLAGRRLAQRAVKASRLGSRKPSRSERSAAVLWPRYERWGRLRRRSSVRGCDDLVGPPRQRQGCESKRRFSGSPIDGSRSEMACRETSVSRIDLNFPRHYGYADAGNVIVTVVPAPRSLATPIDPPLSSMLRFAMVSPRPVPVALVEKYGSKIRRSAS